MINVSRAFFLGLMEIKLKYKRSIIGPWWITISTALTITLLGSLWTMVFGMDLHEYLPYFALGLILWNLFLTQNTDATNLFSKNEALLKEVYISPIEFLISSAISNLIIFFHNFIVILFIIFYFDLFVNNSLFFSIIGFLLFVLFTFFISGIVSMISARYKDAVQIFTVFFNLLFFISPIIWKSDSIKSEFMFIKLNPIYHFLEAIRTPIISGVASQSLYFCLFFVLFAFMVFYFLFKSFNRKIVFWL